MKKTKCERGEDVERTVRERERKKHLKKAAGREEEGK